VRFDYPKRVRDVLGPHSENGPDALGRLGGGELDHDFAIGGTHVDVWRVMLTRRQEDGDAKSACSQDGRQRRR
jgi:hypothetical protein